MKSFSKDLVRALAFVFIIFIFGSWVIVAQTDVTGEWTANIKEKSPDKIHLSFERKTVRRGKNQQGSTYSFSDLHGLSQEQTQNGLFSVLFARLERSLATARLPTLLTECDPAASILKSRIPAAKTGTNPHPKSGFSPRRRSM